MNKNTVGDKMSKIKDIDIIGVQIDFGASHKGVAMGPLAIRYAGLGPSKYGIYRS